MGKPGLPCSKGCLKGETRGGGVDSHMGEQQTWTRPRWEDTEHPGLGEMTGEKTATVKGTFLDGHFSFKDSPAQSSAISLKGKRQTERRDWNAACHREHDFLRRTYLLFGFITVK